jgi:2-polyprenyl-3-methyl-5-hydroxy-6-metoxy-1,4-benzoquinol methylase
MHPVPSFGGEPDAAAATERMKKMMEQVFTSPSSSRISYISQPNAFLVESVKELKPGKALDVGMGQGRNAIHLAGKGWQVTGFDLSPSAIRLAHAEAQKAGVTITALERSDEQFDFGTDEWDLVVLSYVEFRHLMDRIWKGLRPGGHVVVVSPSQRQQELCQQ